MPGDDYKKTRGILKPYAQGGHIPSGGERGPVPFDESAAVVPDNDAVNHPKHYNNHPSGVECITIARHMTFNIGNVMKYIWRADHKANQIEDLKKAQFYLANEIERLENES